MHSRLAELRQKGRGAGSIGQSAQCAQGIFGAKSEHGAEGIRIDTHATKLVQQHLERLLVGHVYLDTEVITVGGTAP